MATIQKFDDRDVDAGVLLWLLLWLVRCVEVVVVSNGILSDGIFKEWMD
jgi:hypothetical protein